MNSDFSEKQKVSNTRVERAKQRSSQEKKNQEDAFNQEEVKTRFSEEKHVVSQVLFPAESLSDDMQPIVTEAHSSTQVKK